MHGDLSASPPVATMELGHADERAFSVLTVAKRLGMSKATIYREIQDGRITVIRVRGRMSILECEVQRLFDLAHQERVREEAEPTAWGGSPRRAMNDVTQAYPSKRGRSA